MAMDLAVNVDLSIVGHHEFIGALKWMQTWVIMERLHSSYLTEDAPLSESERKVVQVFQIHDSIHATLSPKHGAHYHLTRATLTTWERMRVGVTEIGCYEGSPVHRALMAFEQLGLIALWRSGSNFACRLRMPRIRVPR